MTSSEFEYKLITTFVESINKDEGSNYQFVCRPDKQVRDKKAPDFKFVDKSKSPEKVLLLELKRHSATDLSSYKEFQNKFSQISKVLDGEIKGSFVITFNSELSESFINNKIWQGNKDDLIKVIRNKSVSLNIEESIELKPGIKFAKILDQGSSIIIMPPDCYADERTSRSTFSDWLSEAKIKFEYSHYLNSINYLIIITHTMLSISQRWKQFLSFLEYSQPKIDYTFDIYNLVPFFADKPIFLEKYSLKKYHQKWGKMWMKPDQLFDDLNEYNDAVLHYFIGSV